MAGLAAGQGEDRRTRATHVDRKAHARPVHVGEDRAVVADGHPAAADGELISRRRDTRHQPTPDVRYAAEYLMIEPHLVRRTPRPSAPVASVAGTQSVQCLTERGSYGVAAGFGRWRFRVIAPVVLRHDVVEHVDLP